MNRPNTPASSNWQILLRTISRPQVLGLIMAALAAASCARSHPASQLQETVIRKVESPEDCLKGDSQSLQELIQAGSDTGVVELPAGCYQITATITLPAGMKLIGAGAEHTILFRDPEGSYSTSMIHIRGRSDSPAGTQVSGISLIGVRNDADPGEDYGIRLTSVSGFRVDHSYFEGFGFAGIRVDGTSTGVIDHAVFVDNFKRGIDNLGYGVVIYGPGPWNPELQPGGAEAVFIEDSIFSGNRHAVASNQGAHYVFRYNQVLNGVVACGVDAHGMGYGSAHGTQYVEIYGNWIERPADKWCGIGIRGGGGVIFDNTIRGYDNAILLILEWGTPAAKKSTYPAFEQIRDMYIWDNSIKGGPAVPVVDETGQGFIEEDRDYFQQEKPGYTPFPYPHPEASGGPYDSTTWPPGSDE